jgi:hypothetical protein
LQLDAETGLNESQISRRNLGNICLLRLQIDDDGRLPVVALRNKPRRFVFVCSARQLSIKLPDSFAIRFFLEHGA